MTRFDSGPARTAPLPSPVASRVDRAEDARRAIAENPVWYHTIELAPGIATPGQVDMREAAARALPADLSGRRALDVGTFDGFWAYEMERRGADVVAIDVETIDAAECPANRVALLRPPSVRDMRQPYVVHRIPRD